MRRILITGAAGMIGGALVKALAGQDVVATDLTRGGLGDAVAFEKMDVTGADVDRIIARVRPDVVVHLASIVTPPPGLGRAAAYAVDVTGTRNVLDACLAHRVRRLVVTSSGAAYGYHADNPEPLSESDPCRGNREFAYADHKRQVEEMLAEARTSHPALEQVVLRVGTVLGPDTDNQITALFERPRLLAIRGRESPFVFVWIDDLVAILHRAAQTGPAGVFNVAGDGAVSVHDMAQMLDKPVLHIPAIVLKAGLAIAKPLGLSRYGPEQVRFLQYRPVLSNARLKTEFGYTPRMTSCEVFAAWQEARSL